MLLLLSGFLLLSPKKINEPVGEYFNLSGHKWEDMEDMTVVIIDHNLIERTRISKKKKF